METRRTFASSVLALVAGPFSWIRHSRGKPTASAVELHGTMDAMVWAKSFCAGNSPSPGLDIMIGWFANSIMCGYDHATWKCSKLKTFGELMGGSRQNEMEAVLVQAIAMLSTEPRFSHLTPEKVYDRVVNQMQEIRSEFP